MHVDSQQLITALIALLFAVFVVRRTLRPQVVRVWALVATPAVLFAVSGLVVAASPSASANGTLIIIAGALLGGGLGYARGVHSRVTLGPRPGTLIVTGNAILVAILLGAFAVRAIGRAVFGATGALGPAISDAFLVFAAASVGVARGMLFFSWRRLDAANRAAPTSS